MRSPQNFSSIGVHRSRFEYGALGIVSIISPSSVLGIAHHFFNGLLVLQGILYQNFKFFLNRLNQSPKFQFSQSSLEHARIRSTWACLDHISLIRTWNRVQFFYGLLVLQGIFYQNFNFFYQPAQPVPKVSIQPKFIGACLNLEHLGLF